MKKEITNTELLESINRSFSKIEEKMATKDDIKELDKKLSFRISGLERRIDDYAETKVSYENLKPIVKRIEVLEKA